MSNGAVVTAGRTLSAPVSSGSQIRQAYVAQAGVEQHADRSAAGRRPGGGRRRRPRPVMPNWLCGSVSHSRRAAAAGEKSWPISSRACASAQAAPVLTGTGSGSRSPRSRRSTRSRSQSTARWSSGPDEGTLRAGPLAADRVAGPVVVRVARRSAPAGRPRSAAAAWRRAASSRARRSGCRRRPGTVPVSRRPSPRSTSTSTDAPLALAYAGGVGPQLLALRDDLVERRRAEPAAAAGCRAAARRSSPRPGPARRAARAAGGRRSATSRGCRASTGIASASSSGSNGVDTSSRSRRNVRTGWTRNALRSASDDVVARLGRGQRAGEQRRRLVPHAPRRPGAAEGGGVEAERPRPARSCARRTAGAGGAVTHLVAHRRGGRAVDGVEELAERYRGWALRAGLLVGAGVGDHEVLAGGQHRVEQQLAVLAARVALAGERPARRARRRRRRRRLRGKTPSSRPTRQTTRCGTERIGTIVQTVSVPVRKLARVGRGRPAATAAARARRRAAARARPPGDDRGRAGELALELRQLPGVVGRHVGRGRGRRRAAARSTRRRCARPRARSGTRRGGRPARRAGRPGRSRCCRRRRAAARGRGAGGRRRSSRPRAGSGRARPARCCGRTAPARTPRAARRRAPTGRRLARPSG